MAIAGLTWRPYGRHQPVLQNLTLTIPAGQRVLLVGPSGSGKSTLLRAIAGLLESADAGDRSGSVTVDGLESGSVPGMVGMVLQEPGAGIVAATVERDVAFGPENVGMPRSQMPATVAEALAAVGLDRELTAGLGTPTDALSGGQTQRLAIAGALALSPSVLLLDEPTAMLDPANAAAVRSTVADVAARQHLTTVVVEHVMEPWLTLVDRLVVLGADGSVTADGVPDVVLAEHADRLAAQGIWVPDVPAPTPVTVDADTFDIGPADGRVVLRAEQVRFERPVRSLTGGRRTVLALDGATASGRAGELTALVGPSGSGKSTMLLALAGLLEPVSGTTTATDLSSSDLARRVAWVPQWASSTIVADTVEAELLVTARAVGVGDRAAERRAQALLDALGLTHLSTVNPRHLSGGEQRRLAIAGALVHQPRALLADEPTVGQDRLTWAAIVGVVQAYRAAGGAVVTATHDATVIARANEVVRIQRPSQPPSPRATRQPLLARCGPLSLLGASLLGIPAGILSPGWRVSLLALAMQLVLGAIGLIAPGRGQRPRGRARRVALRTVPGVIGGVSVAWSTWLLGGHDLGLAATGALRVLLIVVPAAFLVPFVDADALGDHLGQRLRLPARPVVALAAAIQRVHTFGAIWTEIRQVRQIRGIGGGRGPVALVRGLATTAFGLLVRTLGSAADLAVAMDARGFATARQRTWYAAAPWRWTDTVLLLVAAVPLVPILMVG